MNVSTTRNQEDKANLLLNTSHIDENVFKRGFGDFFRGERIVHVMSEKPYSDALHYLDLHKAGQVDNACKIVDKYSEQGITLEHTAQGVIAYIQTQASNPYTANTQSAQEWQRGYNAAYKASRRRLMNTRPNKRN